MKLSRLKAVREAKLLTIRRLADRAGVSPATVVRIEHGGDAALRTVRALCGALDVEPGDLV